MKQKIVITLSLFVLVGLILQTEQSSISAFCLGDCSLSTDKQTVQIPDLNLKFPPISSDDVSSSSARHNWFMKYCTENLQRMGMNSQYELDTCVNTADQISENMINSYGLP